MDFLKLTTDIQMINSQIRWSVTPVPQYCDMHAVGNVVFVYNRC
jgi:hypothetical protein